MLDVDKAKNKYEKSKQTFELKGAGFLGINKKKFENTKLTYAIEKTFADSVIVGKNVRFSDKFRMINFAKNKVTPYDKIASVEYKVLTHIQENNNFKTKKKGVISRGLVGGVLLGPAGMLAGAATAGSKTTGTVSSHEVIDGFLIRAFNNDGSEIFHIRFSKEDPARITNTKLTRIVEDNKKLHG